MESMPDTEADEKDAQPEVKKAFALDDPSDMIVYEENISSNTDIEVTQPSDVERNLPVGTVEFLSEPEMCGNAPNATLSTIVANQVVINNNQQKNMTFLAQLATAVDMLNKSVISIENSVQSKSRPEVIEVTFKPVSSREELDHLEADLKNESNMLRYIEKLSSICGTTGKSDGIDSAYRLIDCMATREMINMCSWTGQTRENCDQT
ncbi:uncharacterized protein LOC131678588 isoform X1 [Topomyia yanbarensis]|uniref:uncharacterized protein LOC131678588 isoform X1 n=1 Tax=Topomyia yanbarensis TaxID=2498891 RepID=UPI00273CA8F1|nr:uncharacterized protein LOC131678588 isoform X1 [Topomyia yanbarensis]